MTIYPERELWDEITFLGYHLHWPLDELLDLEHADRTRIVGGVADLNRRAWEGVLNA